MRRAATTLAVAAVLCAMQPAAATPGPAGAPEYWFDSWHVQSLWDAGVRGQGVTIAVIDTGVNADVPELAGRILSGADLGQDGGNGHVDREIDAFGHGTAMASIMVARPGLLDITGIAPRAKVLPIAIPLNGTSEQGGADQLPAAIRYAADHGAKIISMSLGGKRSPTADTQPCNDDEQAAIYHALRKGAVVLAAVGNTGPSKNTIEDPGVCLGVVTVGAVDASGAVAPFSGRQPYLSLVAPGVDVPSLGRVPGQAYSGDGTSQATALTSAALALVWSRYPKLSGRAVVTRLLATLDAHRSTPSTAYGYGLLDAYRAVTATVPANAANPVYDAVEPFLARAAAVAASRPKPPAPAKVSGSTGSYSVGTSTRLTAQVLAGLAITGGALLLLALLVGFGVRGRRRRKAEIATPGVTYGVPDGWVPTGWAPRMYPSEAPQISYPGPACPVPRAAPEPRTSPAPGPGVNRAPDPGSDARGPEQPAGGSAEPPLP